MTGKQKPVRKAELMGKERGDLCSRMGNLVNEVVSQNPGDVLSLWMMAAWSLGISCLCFVDCSLGVASGSGSLFLLPCLFAQLPLLRTQSAVAWRAANTAVGAMGSSVCVLCVCMLCCVYLCCLAPCSPGTGTSPLHPSRFRSSAW